MRKADILEWSQKRGFWESFRYTYGGWDKAGKALHLSPDLLRRVARAPDRYLRYVPSDATLAKLQEAVSHVGERKLKVAKKYATKARAHFTPNQLFKVIPKYTRTRQGQAYFMEQIEKYRVNRPAHYTGGQYYNETLLQEYRMRWRKEHRKARRLEKRLYRMRHPGKGVKRERRSANVRRSRRRRNR